VAPYVEWLEKTAGFIPLDKLPEPQAWIAKLRTQAYIGVGDYEGLDALSKRVKPQETFVGRQGEFRFHAFDIGYPDYRIPEPAKKWLKYARELGFHVGMHFNIKCVSAMFPELVERFRPGFAVIGKDAQGNDTYESIYEGPNRLYRVSAALKDWRDYFVEQVKEAVEAGIDVVYLDEAMSPSGKFMVDGMDGYEGILEMMRQILAAYPHVAVETEQFNTLTAKYGKLALSQMPLGHPLSAYIFQKFVKVVPEGLMYSPTDMAMMDAFDVWGIMLPGADTQRGESWMQIAEAFHKYQLVPSFDLEHKQCRIFEDHFTHGSLPVCREAIPAGGEKLFGFKGANGATAYLEKHPDKRGLVVYQPGQEPLWVGTRQHSIRSYRGPGMPVYYGYRELIQYWLIYNGTDLLGLNPQETYWIDETLPRTLTDFHVFAVPDDFCGASNMEARALSQERGRDKAYYILRMAGRGRIGVYIPEDYEAYLNGEPLPADPATRQAYAAIDAANPDPAGLGYFIALSDKNDEATAEKQAGPAMLIAFKKTDTVLNGDWLKLPYYASGDPGKWITGNDYNGYKMNVGAIGRIVGKFPAAKKISLQGSYQIDNEGTGFPGDGVLRLNGKEVWRVPHGEKPYPEQPFNVDATAFAGQYVILEFHSDGPVRGKAADWMYPKFVVEE